MPEPQFPGLPHPIESIDVIVKHQQRPLPVQMVPVTSGKITRLVGGSLVTELDAGHIWIDAMDRGIRTGLSQHPCSLPLPYPALHDCSGLQSARHEPDRKQMRSLHAAAVIADGTRVEKLAELLKISPDLSMRPGRRANVSWLEHSVAF